MRQPQQPTLLRAFDFTIDGPPDGIDGATQQPLYNLEIVSPEYFPGWIDADSLSFLSFYENSVTPANCTTACRGLATASPLSETGSALADKFSHKSSQGLSTHSRPENVLKLLVSTVAAQDRDEQRCDFFNFHQSPVGR